MSDVERSEECSIFYRKGGVCVSNEHQNDKMWEVKLGVGMKWWELNDLRGLKGILNRMEELE